MMTWLKAASLLFFSVPLLAQAVDINVRDIVGQNEKQEMRPWPEFDPNFDCYTDCKDLWCECVRPNCYPIDDNDVYECALDHCNATLYPNIDNCFAFCGSENHEDYNDYEDYGDHDGFDPYDFFGECETSSPTTSPAPTTSLSPTVSPTTSQAPSTSSAPTRSCACPDCEHDSGCNNDPHYRTWSHAYYDYQGSCDQIAIDNNVLQLQIRTRPRGGYTTVTQVAFEMKDFPGQIFRATADATGSGSLAISNTLSTAPVSVNPSNVGTYNEKYKITFTSDPSSYILIRKSYTGINVDARGKGAIFCGSEGMFGSWDDGGVKYFNGTDFVLSGNYYTDRANAVGLAQSWQVPDSNNLLDPPSTICDGEAGCGGFGQLPCDSINRRLGQDRKLEEAYLGCNQTCDDITGPDFLVEFCKRDVEITSDASWACDPAYVDPQVVEVLECEFRTRDDAMCSKRGDTCQRLGGSCRLDCTADEGHVCLPGICSIDRAYEETMVRHLKKGGSKKSHKSKSSKSTKSSESPVEDEAKKSKTFKSSKSSESPTEDEGKKCMCYAPVGCATAP